MRRVVFTQAARHELIDAQDWYERERAGLGVRFRAQIDHTLKRIADGPLLFPRVYKNSRHALVEHFPYLLIFVLESDDSVTVIACFHGSRDPMQWRKRI